MPTLSPPATLPLSGRTQLLGSAAETYTLDSSFTACAIFLEGSSAGWFRLSSSTAWVALPAGVWFALWQRPEQAGAIPIDYSFEVKAGSGVSGGWVGHLAW